MDGAFTTSDGLKLSFRTGGNPKGPPVLFIYGLVCSAFHFKYQWEHLKPTHRLLMLDYRAHHVSEHPEAITTLTFVRIVEDLREFLDHLKITAPVNLIGHSMGVNLALEFFARHPERVAALIVMAGAATFPAEKRGRLKGVAFFQTLLKTLDGLFPNVTEEFWRKQAHAPGSRHVAGFVGFNRKLSKREDIEGVVKVVSGFSPRVFVQLLGEYLAHDRRSILREIRVPSLIVSGERDRMVAARFQRDLHKGIRGSKLLVVPGGSHCPQFDRPDLVNAELEAFLKNLRA